jgi:hypothetical protein
MARPVCIWMSLVPRRSGRAFECIGMSAYVKPRWRGTKESDFHNLPDFGDGGACWADWLAQVTDRFDLEAIVKKFEVSELLAHKAHGSYWFQGTWVPPQRMFQAAERLERLVRSGNEEVRPLLEVYALHAVGAKSVEDEFVSELHDIKTIAGFLEQHGAKKMTLEVGGW